jgi:hypothetical protein
MPMTRGQITSNAPALRGRLFGNRGLRAGDQWTVPEMRLSACGYWFEDGTNREFPCPYPFSLACVVGSRNFLTIHSQSEKLVSHIEFTEWT